MTTIEDVLTYIDGSNANGRLVVAWKPFTVGNVNAAGGELEWPIVDGEVSISLYANTGAQPTGSYYVAKYELENGAVYLEQWVVPNLPTVNLGQVRVSFPPSPSVMISPLQLTSLNAQPGMFLQWDGQRWVPAYPSTFNIDPNWIGINTDATGNDVGVIGSPVHLGNSVTIHIPDAGLTSRGVVTTSPQSFGGVKTFANTVNISTSIKFTLRSVAPVYGELLGFGTGGADTSLSFGGNIIASRVSPVDRPYVRADNFIGSSLDLATFGIVPTAVMPGSLANPARTLAAFLLPVAGTVDWTGIGTDTTGALWLRTGTSTSAGFLYLDTAGNVTAREFRMDPYQHLNAPGVEATRNDATMVMYSGTTDWAGYGVNSTPEMWFRMGPNAAGAYYYFGAGGARFPGNLTVGNIVVTGGVTLPAGTYVPTSRRVNTSTGLTGGGPLTADLTLSAVDNTTTQKVEAAQAGLVKAVRKRLNFIAGAGQLITVVDDSGNDQANVTITSSTSGSATPSIYSVNGTPVGTQPELNLVAGTNVILNGVNNGGLNRVDITVTTSGGAAITDPTTAIGDLVVRGTATPSPLTRLGVGATTGYVLTTDLTTAPFIKWADKVPITRQIIAGAGLGGGGALGGMAATDVTLTANVVSVNGQTGAVVLTAANVGGVPTTRQVIAGTGLTGGGPLSSDVTLAVVNDTVTERVRISNAGTLIGTRQQINFIQGSNITLTVADVPGSNWVGVTVAATTSGLSDPTTTKGDLIVRPVGPPATRMGVGVTDGMVLTVDSTDATFGIKWKAVPASPQSPWLSDIDGAGFKLKSTGNIGVGNDATGLAFAGYPQLIVGPSTASSACGIIEACGNTSSSGALVGVFSGVNFAITATDKRIGQIGFLTDGAISSGAIVFQTSATLDERMRITATGNVGIGTASPNFPLEIRQQSVNPALNVIPLASYTRATIGFGCNAAMSTGWIIGEGLDSVTKDFYFTDLTAGAARMYISTAGNVGIGTASPGYLLDVGNFTGSSHNSIRVAANAGFDSYLLLREAANSYGFTIYNAHGSGLNILRHNGDINGVTAMFIDRGTGNVGIGTTGPTGLLETSRPHDTGWNLRLTLSGIGAAGQGGGMDFYDSTNANQMAVIQTTAEASYGACLQFWTKVSSGGPGVCSEKMRITAAGNVGIGTTGPLFLLSLGASVVSRKLAVYDSGSDFMGFGVASGTFRYDAGLFFDHVFYTNNGTERMRINGSGNVGVGVSPSYKLDVAGDVNCSGVFRRNGAPICQINTMYNQTGVRALNTVYQNTTGLPMFVNITATIASLSYMKLLSDAGNPPAFTVYTVSNAAGGGTTIGGTISGWVMPGHFYKADAPSDTLITWTEWF